MYFIIRNISLLHSD